MLPTIPTLPWYTYVALVLVALLVLGCVWAMLRLAVMAFLLWVNTSWLAFWALISRLIGGPALSHGSAHWASSREMTAAGIWNADGLPLASSHTGRTIHEPRGSHIAVIAPPRSGKSWGIVMPILRQFRGSAIVTDLRAELFAQTGEVRSAMGEVFLFNPADDHSCSLNLLDNIRWGSAQEFADVDRVAQHLLAPTGSDLGDDFRRHAVPLMRAVIMQCRHAGEGHFPGVAAWFTSAASVEEKLAALAQSPNLHVRSGARRTQDMGERLRANVWSVCTEALAIFEDPQIIAHTRTSDCLLSQLIDGIDPVTIYLTISFSDVRRLGRFLGLFVELFTALISSPHAPARHKVLLCLDEAANLGALRELESGMSYLQGSGAQCVLVFQNIAQFHTAYGEHSPLLSSVGSFVFYTPTPTDHLTATTIARSLGQATVGTASVSYGDTHTSISEQVHARGLLTVDEVLRFPANDAIVLTQNTWPILGLKLGTPALSRWVRTTFTLRQHPMACATAACACMLAMMLHPLWLVSTTPGTVVASAPSSANPLQASVLPSLASTPPVASLAPMTTQPPTAATTVPQVERWGIYAHANKGLTTHNKDQALQILPSEQDCHTALDQRYAPLLAALQDQLDRKQREGTITHTPGDISYALKAFGEDDRFHARCERVPTSWWVFFLEDNFSVTGTAKQSQHRTPEQCQTALNERYGTQIASLRARFARDPKAGTIDAKAGDIHFEIAGGTTPRKVHAWCQEVEG